MTLIGFRTLRTLLILLVGGVSYPTDQTVFQIPRMMSLSRRLPNDKDNHRKAQFAPNDDLSVNESRESGEKILE